MSMIKDRDEVSLKSLQKSQYFLFCQLHGLNDFLFLGLGFVLLFLAVSLLSYSPDDNGLFVFHSGNTGFKNVCGAVGSYSSDLLLFCLGACAHVWLAFVIAAWAWRGLFVRTKVHVGHFAMSTIVFGVFLALAFRIFAACGVGSYSLAFGNGVFGRMLHAIGPVGVGLLVGTGLFASVCFLFDVTAYQALFAKMFLLRKTLQTIVFFTKESIQVLRYATSVVREWVAYIKSVISAVDEKEEDPEIMRMFFEDRIIDQKNVSQESAELTSPFEPRDEPIDVDVQNHEQVEHLLKNLYVPNPDRVFKFGSISLRLLPVLPKNTHLFYHSEIYHLVRSVGSGRNDSVSAQPFPLPDDSLLIEQHVQVFDRQAFEVECKARGLQLEEKLRHFGIKGSVVAIKPGPVITVFEYQPDVDVKINSIIAREDDLAMVLKALSIRIVAPIPGTSVVGFEIANTQREDVFISDLIVTESWKKTLRIYLCCLALIVREIQWYKI